MASRADLTDDLMTAICEQIAAGKSLRSQLADFDITNGTFFRAVEANAQWAEQYARAREAQADTLADEIVDIADDARSDDDPASRRLRVEARKWVAAKLRPKRWGDRTVVEHDGAVQHKHALDMTALSADQLRALASIQIKDEER